MAENAEIKLIAQNRKAYHDYFVDETIEVGIVLQGTEVKSIREGKINLKDSYALIKDAEVFVENMHISPYSHGNIANHEPTRRRKLLMKRAEINRLIGKVKEKGFTLIPLKVYIKRGKVKLVIGLVRGKHKYDKRQSIADRDSKREIEKAFRERQKG